MNTFKTNYIHTTVHGHYLIHEPQSKNTSPLLIGFHGYGENAQVQMQMLQQIPGTQNWFCCSVQALHPFYNTKDDIGYSWMTSQDRDLRIQENVNYVNAVITDLKNKYPFNNNLVFHGFSQGTAMACRAALLGGFETSGVILLGGDIPPEVENLDKMKRVLMARGKKDKCYSLKKWENDMSRIKHSVIESCFCTFDGGHGGSNEYFQTASKFLKHYK